MKKSFRCGQVYNDKTGSWDDVDANNLTDSDRDMMYRCKECKAEATLVINKDKDNCFRSKNHKRTCDIYKPRIKESIHDGNECNISKFTNPKEHNSDNKPKGAESGDFTYVKGESDEDNVKAIELVVKKRSVIKLSKILSLLSEGEDVFDKNDGSNIKDLIINNTILEEIKISKPESKVGILLLEKGKVKSINLKYIDNRIWLKDVQSQDDENAIRFSVAVVGDKDNKEFLSKVYGNGVSEEEKKNIKVYLIGELIRTSNENERILTYQINIDKDGYVMYADAPNLGDIFYA